MKRTQLPLCVLAAACLLPLAGLQADLVTLNVTTEAQVQQTITTNIDEATRGYLETKASTSGSASSGRRKVYFQFDLTGQSPNTNVPASFTVTLGNSTVTGMSQSGQQRVRLWALNQAYPGFSSALIWDTAQANTATDVMATTGTYTATALTDTNNVVPSVGGGSESQYSFTVSPPWGKFIQDNKLILVLAGVPDSAYNGGQPARMRTNAATFTFNSTAGDQPPTISAIANQTVTARATAAPVPFTVQDDRDPASWLWLDATTSDEAVVSLSGIMFLADAGGTNRTVTITGGSTPGTATITVFVHDSLNQINQTSFTVTVLPDPVISTIAHTNSLMNQPVTVAFTVGSASAPVQNLTLSGVSGNPALVQDTGITFSGSGADRKVTVTPVAGQDGIAPITVTVSDGVNTASASFAVMVRGASDIAFVEHFAYADGNLSALSAGFWALRTTGTRKISVAGQQATWTGPLGSTYESVLAPLAGGAYTPDGQKLIYSSMKANWTTLPRDSTGPFLHLANPAGDQLLAKVHVLTNGVTDGFFRLGIASGPGNVYVDFPRDLTTNTTYTIVSRYDVDTGASALWIDPASADDLNSISATDVPVAAIGLVGLRNRDGMGTMFVDDLKVQVAVKPLVTTVTRPSASMTELDFSAGTTDTPATFRVEGAAAVAGPYAEVSAVITLLGGGQFRAQLAGATASQQFYRVSRPALVLP